MASIDKVKVGETTYDVSPSKDGTLNGYTSGDTESPASWTSVNTITTSDTNSTVFNKVTSMVKNIRWLYSKLGNTDFSATGQNTVTGALSSMQSSIDGKAPATHSHTVSDLPVSSSQVNSTSYIPTCALLYSMNEKIEAMEIKVDNIEAGTITDPNDRYVVKQLDTWASTAAVDEFFNKFTHSNYYRNGGTELSLGNYVRIQDGTYNVDWVIAGFDKEYNQSASDGTMYNNGYGICLIPKTQVTTGQWNTSATTSGGYKSSYMHNTVLPNIVTKLKTILGTHIVNRNVLLSSTVTSGNSSAYTWTTADATLMSVGQMTGTFASHNTKYDDGEAIYKLPLFNYEDFKTGSDFWSRGVSSAGYAWRVNGDGYISGGGNVSLANSARGVRPLIYLR